ncbi:MAG: nitronate monooxygenase [Candidatus Lambdaproteobacteria bacterium]|nr:nitronate monooxygenase [Candidatus Lambdaproteobacteria bacterium]
MARPRLRTKLCETLNIEVPILLAGMGSRGKATPPALVAAVSEAGGMGVIGGSGLPPEVLQEAIRETRRLTRRPIGVDLLLPATLAEGAGATRSEVREQLRARYPEHVAFVRGLMAEHGLPEVQVDDEAVVSARFIQEQVRVVLAEDVQVFAAGLGDPAWVVPQAHQQGLVVMGLAGAPRNAQRQIKAGVDIIVAQGYEAGGHTGKIASFALIPQVVDAARPKPVVAAGGIGDGRGIAAALALGAEGVWVGTAFLVAQECAISDLQKEQIINGRSEDFEIQRFYTGKTARVVKNSVIAAWEKSGLPPLPMPYQKILMDDFNEAAVTAGRFDLHSNPAGQIGGMLTERKPAARIMEELVSGAIEALAGLRTRLEVGAG